MYHDKRQLFKPEKNSKVDLHSRANIQTFTTEWPTSKQYSLQSIYTIYHGTPHGTITKMLNCDLKVSKLNSSFIIMFTFRLIPPGKVSSQLYLPTPPLGQDMTHGQFFKRSLTGLNSEFSFS